MFLCILNFLLAFFAAITNGFLFFIKNSFNTILVLKTIGVFLISFILIYILICLLIWIYFIIIALTINPKKEYKSISKFYHRQYVNWYKYLNAFCRIKIKTSGFENIPFGTKFLLVCNHRSAFDVFVQTAALKNESLAVISKPENFKLPIANRYMIRNLYLSIDREDVRKALITIMKAIDFVKNDVTSISVFPEGTRSKTGKLLDFKPGCLKIAESSLCPVVVCTLNGTEKVHKNFPFKKTVVNFDIIKVYTKEDILKTNTIDMSSEIHEMMLNHLNNM